MIPIVQCLIVYTILQEISPEFNPPLILHVRKETILELDKIVVFQVMWKNRKAYHNHSNTADKNYFLFINMIKNETVSTFILSIFLNHTVYGFHVIVLVNT
jgi:hypothetical protein